MACWRGLQGWGQAAFGRAAKQVSLVDGLVFEFTAVPLVTSLSYSAAGLNAGSQLVITGSGFSIDPSASAVTLAGMPCNITSATASQLTCIPGPAPASTNSTVVANTYYPHGRGMLHNIWFNTQVTGATTIAATPGYSVINTDAVVGYY
jgi:hypothetical protein